jgi:plasmid stabilization system protein ParE
MRETIMPRGDKSSYTDKQKRQAEHIEEGYEHRGVGRREAERRAWATVNKETGGGKKRGSGRGVPKSNVSSKRGGRIGGPRGGKTAASRPAAARSRSAKKAAASRKRHAVKRSAARKTGRKTARKK